MFRCPGQDQRFWKPGDVFEVRCAECNGTVEFFKDEPQLKCRKCGSIVRNPKIDLGCAQWCQYADKCLGITQGKELPIVSMLIGEMKAVFGDDQKRFKHALSVLNYAEQIQACEGGDPLVVKAAAILHDIGIREAERKYGVSTGKYQEIEGPPIAGRILAKYNIDQHTVNHICEIIANHHSGKNIDTLEFKCVWDADWLVNIPEEYANKDRAELEKLISSVFKTKKGREMAIAALHSQ